MFTLGNLAANLIPGSTHREVSQQRFAGIPRNETSLTHWLEQSAGRRIYAGLTQPQNAVSMEPSAAAASAFTRPWIGKSLLLPSLWRAIAALSAAVWQALMTAQQRAQARRRERETAAILRGLSDATLKDIGIHRTEITSVAANLASDDRERRTR